MNIPPNGGLKLKSRRGVNMTKKRISILLLIVLALSLMVGCDKKETSNEVKKDYICIATGTTKGTYYPLGRALTKIYNDNIKDLRALDQSTQGSVENMVLMGKGKVEIGFVQSDIAYYAFTGTEIFKDKDKVENIRGMTMLYPEIVQIIANKDANISKVEDLKGKTVAIGAIDSGIEANARQILGIHDIKYQDLKDAQYLPLEEAIEKLKNKEIDAAFITAGIPTSAILEIEETSNFVFISISKDKIQNLNKKYPFYKEVHIPAGTYKGQDKDILTAGIMAMLVVSEDLDEDLVYDLTKSIFEYRDTIIDSHDRGNDIKLERAISGMPIELHKGAKRYFDEKGID